MWKLINLKNLLFRGYNQTENFFIIKYNSILYYINV